MTWPHPSVQIEKDKSETKTDALEQRGDQTTHDFLDFHYTNPP